MQAEVDGESVAESRISWLPRVPAAVLVAALVGLLVTIWLYSPGYMSPDSIYQLEQARSGYITNAHPPAIAIIWSLVDRVYPGPLGMLLIQNALFWGGLALFASSLRMRVRFQVLVVLAIGLFPPVFGLLGTIWKDVWLLGALTMVVGLLSHIPLVRKPAVITVGAAVFSVLAVGVRHNAIIALLGLAFWAANLVPFIRERTGFRRFLYSVGGAVLMVAIVVAMSTAISRQVIDRYDPIWLRVATFDIAGISVREGTMLFPSDSPVLKEGVDLDDIAAAYWPRYFDTLYRDFCGDGSCPPPVLNLVRDDAELSRLRSTWFESIANHPVAWLQHRWAVFSHVLGITDFPVWGPVYYTKIFPNDLGYEFETSTANRRLTEAFEWLDDTPLYWVWIYGLGLVVLTAVGTVIYARRSDAILVGIASSGLLYLAGYFVVAGSPDFRYSLWSIVASLLGLAYAAAQWSSKRKTPMISEVSTRE